MDERGLPVSRWVICWVTAAAALIGGCQRPKHTEPEPPAPRKVIRIMCAPQDAMLACDARIDAEARAGVRDVTALVDWTSSDERVARVDRGRVTSSGRGAADIHVSAPGHSELLPSSITVFAEPGKCPEIGYAVEGELRDVNNVSIRGATVTLLGAAREAVPIRLSADGDGFRFYPIPPGHYRIRADKAGFRASGLDIEVPTARSMTLVLLPEPSDLKSDGSPGASPVAQR